MKNPNWKLYLELCNKLLTCNPAEVKAIQDQLKSIRESNKKENK